MNSKLCDAADWFRPEVHEIITNELREVPRFHRKQWELAMIFLSLRQGGKLHPNSLGLSMGGGRELIMYALAPHVKQLVVTDLYDMHTDWDCAKTHDPDAFIKANKPFPADDTKLRALRMDMRDLRFPDSSFDFCYSTCAIEHIGSKEDFLRHFNEVSRVLKDDGVYVFTTEVSYGDSTIRDDHNYVFSLKEMDDMLSESSLAPEPEFDACVTHHKINYPLPSDLKNLSRFSPTLFTEELLQESPHIQLMRGKHPFTCGVFIARKRRPSSDRNRIHFIGLGESRKFMESGVNIYRALQNSSSVSINPFSLLPNESSRFYADHSEFFAHVDSRQQDAETVFHSDYFWFGAERRVFDVTLEPVGEEPSEIELRVHSIETLTSSHVDCVAHSNIVIGNPESQVYRITVDTNEDYTYAILAKVRGGACRFRRIEIMGYPEQITPALTVCEDSLAEISVRWQR